MVELSFMLKVLMISASVVLSACGYRSEYLRMEFGRIDSVRINQAFNDLHNGHYLYFQNGKRVSLQLLDHWSGYCSLYVYDENYGPDHLNSVSPGDFRIGRITRKKEIAENSIPSSLSGISLAGFEWPRLDSPSYVEFQVRFELNSDRHSNVKALICVQRDDPYYNNYPTLTEIRRNLGKVVEISSSSQ